MADRINGQTISEPCQKKLLYDRIWPRMDGWVVVYAWPLEQSPTLRMDTEVGAAKQ